MSKRPLRLGFVALVLLCTALAAGCAPRLVAVGPPRGGLVTQTADAQAVRDALARALQARRFTIESETDGKLVARLDHRGRTLRVAIEYGPDSYTIGYEGSTGFAYQVDPQTQQPMISAYYNKYLTKLDRTIQKELERPVREAREAEEARQEAIAEAAAQERAEARRARRQERRRERREQWLAIERERQATERERLRAQAAQAEARAEELRRQPPPVFVDYGGGPVVVDRFAFDVDEVGSDSIVLSADAGREPTTARGLTRGRVPSRRLGLPDACPGFWSAEPQHYVTLAHGVPYLRMEVLADRDTTLAVVTPDGHVWCDDDSAGEQNPRLEGRFPAGTYAVYVGTFQRNERTRYELEMSERRAQPAVARARVRVQSQPRRRPRAQQGRRARPDCRTVLFRQGHDAANAIYCRGVEPYCAEAVLTAGHDPTSLIYCRDVQPRCAVELIRSGQAPTGLIHCRE